MEKTSSQNINEKAKSNKKLELDYSLYLESMYVILYLGSRQHSLPGNVAGRSKVPGERLTKSVGLLMTSK